MNILILHAHWGNRGDEAAIRAMIDSLRTQLPVNKMWIMLVGFKPEQFPYDDIERLDLYPIFFPRSHRLVDRWVGRLDTLLKNLTFRKLSITSRGRKLFRTASEVDRLDPLISLLTFGKLSLTSRGRKFLRAASEADVVIHAPGGPTIGDLNAIGDLHYLYRLLIVKVFKKKSLFFYAPSMGPFSGRLRNTARRFILQRADAIVLREEISQGYLRDQLGLEALVTIDSALQNDIPAEYLEKYDNIWETLEFIKGKKTVGMVVTDLQWHPQYRDTEELSERITTCSIDVADYLLEKGYSVLLIPQIFGNVGEIIYRGEVRLLESISDLIKERVHICPPHIDAYGQQIIIAQLYAIISMRYHPVVFAAKGNIPFISIYYEHKALGFISKVGFTDFSIQVSDISASDIISKFEVLEQNHSILEQQLKAINPLLKEESRRTTGIIVDKLLQLGWRIDSV